MYFRPLLKGGERIPATETRATRSVYIRSMIIIDDAGGKLDGRSAHSQLMDGIFSPLIAVHF